MSSKCSLRPFNLHELNKFFIPPETITRKTATNAGIALKLAPHAISSPPTLSWFIGKRENSAAAIVEKLSLLTLQASGTCTNVSQLGTLNVPEKPNETKKNLK